MIDDNPCKDKRFSRITFCQEYGGKDCNMQCSYAKERSKRQPVEHAVIEVGAVYCACGCGELAEQIFNGIPIPNRNPMLHYRAYRDKVEANIDRKNSLQVASPLEHFAHPDNFDEVRGQI